MEPRGATRTAFSATDILNYISIVNYINMSFCRSGTGKGHPLHLLFFSPDVRPARHLALSLHHRPQLARAKVPGSCIQCHQRGFPVTEYDQRPDPPCSPIEPRSPQVPEHVRIWRSDVIVALLLVSLFRVGWSGGITSQLTNDPPCLSPRSLDICHNQSRNVACWVILCFEI